MFLVFKRLWPNTLRWPDTLSSWPDTLSSWPDTLSSGAEYAHPMAGYPQFAAEYAHFMAGYAQVKSKVVWPDTLSFTKSANIIVGLQRERN